MKYFIGFIVGVLLASLAAWKLTEILAKDAYLQTSVTNLIFLSAIENGLNEEKIQEVRLYVRKMVAYEESNILNNQSDAVLTSTKQKVSQVISSINQYE
ncbi:hypothetical protein [Teredinibacter waterburyi]|uniref:hypothetical protein n=1 Tax=Teredinibacter waterburyi TaxID=1500538 RepID=UPI00165F6A31|nr:hypothetical protein [Teredinibacter waterburyi]